ncbi:MAG TPA: FeS-binding protein [Dehalococcoidia bacterium]|nr:FeS-binding protein [Dehalococcoidia bacterium]
MAKRKVTLTVPKELLLEPIIYTMSHQFNLIINIHLADITEDKGWLVLELEGDEKHIEEGLAWVMAKGVRVE